MEKYFPGQGPSKRGNTHIRKACHLLSVSVPGHQRVSNANIRYASAWVYDSRHMIEEGSCLTLVTLFPHRVEPFIRESLLMFQLDSTLNHFGGASPEFRYPPYSDSDCTAP